MGVAVQCRGVEAQWVWMYSVWRCTVCCCTVGVDQIWVWRYSEWIYGGCGGTVCGGALCVVVQWVWIKYGCGGTVNGSTMGVEVQCVLLYSGVNVQWVLVHIMYIYLYETNYHPRTFGHHPIYTFL